MEKKTQAAHNQPARQDDAEEKLIKELWKAIRTLPKECREVLVLFCFDSCTPKEISEALGIPVSEVRRLLQIAQEHLSIDLNSTVEELRRLSMPADFAPRVMKAIRDKTPRSKGNTNMHP